MTAAPGIPSGVIRSRDLAAALSLPAYEQAWAPVDCMRPDFVAGVEITHTLPALRDDGFSGASTVRGLAGRCRRSVEVVLGAQAPGDCAALVAAMRRLTQAPCSVPLWSEMTELTADVLGGFQDVVYCDPSWRLFAPGQRVMIVEAEAKSGPFGASAHPSGEILRGMAWPYFELHTIKTGVSGAGAIRTDRVLLESNGFANPILRSFRAGARLVPMIDVEQMTVVEAEQITARHMRARVALRERGPSAATSSVAIGFDASANGPLIPPMTAYNATPIYATSINGLPILDLRVQPGRTRSAFVRDSAPGAPGGDVRIGPSTRGPRARERVDVEVLGFTRERARRLLQFFESRGGLVQPFYVALPSERLRLAPPATGVSTISGTTVNVERTDFANRQPSALFAGLPEYVIVEVRDPSMSGPGAFTRYARRVTARLNTTQSGMPVERLTLDSALPAIPRDRVVAIAWAARVRFGGESLTEQWIDGRHARSAFTLEEALDERSVDTITVREPAEPCGDCLTDLGDLCPGSAEWIYPIPLVGEGSDEAAACALHEDNDLVLDDAPTIRLSGSFRYLGYDSACGGGAKVSAYANAIFDARLPRDPAVYPATDRWRMDTGTIKLAPSPVNAHRWLGPFGFCAGPAAPLAPGSGATGAIAARAVWFNGRGATSRLFARITGLKDIDDDPASDAMWFVSVEALANGSFNLGGGLGGVGFSPFLVPTWEAEITSTRGITAMRASFIMDYGGGSVAEFTLTAHVCRVLACAEEFQ